MPYKFGFNKKFNSTDEEWFTLMKKEVIYNTITNDCVKVICPHCGSNNIHSPKEGHRHCDLWGNGWNNNYGKDMLEIGEDGMIIKGKPYDCPGYTLKCGFTEDFEVES